jgi:hypothetical protein
MERMRNAFHYMKIKGPGQFNSHRVIDEIGHTQFTGGIIKLRSFFNEHPEFGYIITGSGK